MPRLLIRETEIFDPHALRATCRHLKLPQPILSEWSIGEEQFIGFLLSLPDCSRPVLLDTLTGLLRGVVASDEHALEASLASFLNTYADQKAKRDAHMVLPIAV